MERTGAMRVGLVGGGLAGRLFCDALREKPGGAELVAIATRDGDRAKALATEFGVPRCYAGWERLVADPEIDLVCVGAPHAMHAKIAIAAARAGKHVLVEKPMASNVAEADAMIAAAEAAGVTLGVIFNYRFMDTAIMMRRAITEGRIGRPILAECIGKYWRSQEYYDSAAWRGTWAGEAGGALMTQTSHDIDLMLWMLGPVDSLAGYWTTTPIHQIEVDDLAVASLRFENGALGSIVSSSAMVPASERVVTVHGETGTISLIGDAIGAWRVPGPVDPEVQRILNEKPPDRGDVASTPYYTDPELHRRQIEDLVRSIQAGQRPAIDGREGRRAVEVITAIYRSQETGAVVKFPLEQ